MLVKEIIKVSSMSVIRDLKPDDNDMGWLEGKFDSKSLFQEEMSITIFSDSEESKKYAEKCVEHYNKLNENQGILDDIQEKLAKFMLFMYDEWKEMDIYDDIVADTEKAVEVYNAKESLITCLSRPRLYVELPEDETDVEEIGYCIETECPWEPEHQCSIIIRGDEVKYVGPSEGNTPWDDDDEYYCIWND